MTATLSVSPLAYWLIGLYQRYLSPYKGFRCAYRVRHRRRASCSAFARRAIERLGVLPGVRLLRRRFDKCSHASILLEYETARAKEKGRWKDACWRNADCAPGCDAGIPTDACDLASGCDVGGCDLSF